MRPRRRRRGRRLRPAGLARRGPRVVGAALGRPSRRAGARRRARGVAARRAPGDDRRPRPRRGNSRCGPVGAGAGRRRRRRHGAQRGAPRRAHARALPRARRSRSTVSPATCPERSTCRCPTSSPPTARSCRPTSIRARAAEVGVHRDTPVGTSCGSGSPRRRCRWRCTRPGSTRSPTSVVERVDRGPARPVATGPQP